MENRKKLKDLGSAVRTIFKFGGKRLPASRANTRGFGMKIVRLGVSVFAKYASATVAFQKRLAAFYGNQGDEKKADIMIHPLQTSRWQTAIRARTRLIVHLNFFGLHSADEKEEDAPPGETLRFPLYLIRYFRPSLKAG